jgi:hypothetical protein
MELNKLTEGQFSENGVPNCIDFFNQMRKLGRNRAKKSQKITEIRKNLQKLTKINKNTPLLSRYGLGYLRV